MKSDLNGLDFEIEYSHLNGLSYIDAILELCESRKLDYEEIIKIINVALLNKVKFEFEKRNMVKNSNCDTTNNFFD